MKHTDFRAAREFLEKKSLNLMVHEKKGHAPVGWPPQSFEEFSIGQRIFYIVRTNVFARVIYNTLPEACINQSNYFGTGNAKDVIEGIYNISPFGHLESFAELLKSENFCYVIENINGIIQDRILRIDLFRFLKGNKKNSFDFVGGIFHAFKHFSYQGRPLSTSKQIHDIARPDSLIGLIAQIFFERNFTKEGDTDYTVELPYDEKLNLVFVFYHEIKTDVYFLRTVRQKRRQTK